jgi:hypothetical protein
MGATTTKAIPPQLAPCGCPVRLRPCHCGLEDFGATDCSHDVFQPTECATCEAEWSA